MAEWLPILLSSGVLLFSGGVAWGMHEVKMRSNCGKINQLTEVMPAILERLTSIETNVEWLKDNK